jgi:hypothetical protein
MSKYLYGASVQGIQGFIFQTNKLKEIIGASELIEQICTTKFWQVAGIKEHDANIILNAAGNIKYVFEDKTACERFVRNFPKMVTEMASGITISQAVVAFESQVSKDDIVLLDKRLAIQRNKAVQIPSTNLMVSEVSRRTGGAGVRKENNPDSPNNFDVLDLAQSQKRAASKDNSLLSKIVGIGSELKFPKEMDDISSKDSKNWIAVVHADGNNLGQKISKVMESNDIQEALKSFSVKLNQATIQATQDAFNDVFNKVIEKDNEVTFRPVLLGGDDLTAIIRGDLAIEFTKKFLEKFEKYTKSNFVGFSKKYGLVEDLFENGLTACAGIAFIKSSYPFHYGVKLSESLCKEAKNLSKSINPHQTPSSLLFHKVHSSFVEEYDDIIEKELTAKGNVQFNYGPYFTKPQEGEGYLTISDLLTQVKEINLTNAPKSSLTKWLIELRQDESRAEQLHQRINTLYKGFREKLSLDNPFPRQKDGKRYTPIFDIVSLSNIQNDNKNG